MRQQLITDDSFSEAEAMRLVRSLGARPRLAARPRAESSPVRQAAIARTVEDEVIPRLLRASRPTQPASPPEAAEPMLADEVSALTALLLGDTPPQEAASYVEQMKSRGVSTEQLLLNLLTPAACRLGTMWAEDSCSFADVTIGMLRLANVMRVVGHAFETEIAPVRAGPRALLVQAPGEQHGFGVAMVACFFRRAGWNVTSEPVADRAALAGLVRRDWFSLAGLSLARSDRLDDLAADIRAIRAASRNPAIGIMVGGFAFSEHPQLADMVGADCTAADAPAALRRANALVSQLARGR